MWICSKCKKGNQDITSFCTCGAERMWVCSTCETLNPVSAGICSVCGSQKPAIQPPQQTPAGNSFGGSMAAPQPAPARAASAAPVPVPMPAAAPSSAPAPAPVSSPAPASAAASSYYDEPSAATEAAAKKRKRIRTGLVIANVALFAANVVGLILIMR
ncbi:MAG: hypothetical protein IKI58_11420 [Oscillospiraceae bacterium]|nr:hypothetical protein [Oscillospiraceae bacterium]